MGTHNEGQYIYNQALNQGMQGIFQGSVYFTQYYQEQTTRKLFDTIPPYTGYISRPEEEAKLTELLIQLNCSGPVVLSGLSGTGKTWLATQVIHNLQRKDLRPFPGGILWGSLTDREPQQLLHECIAVLGHTAKYPDMSEQPLRKVFWEHVRERSERLLVVFDDVRDTQQLVRLLPDHYQSLPNCVILVICTQNPYQLISFDSECHLELDGFHAEEIQCLFMQYLKLSPRQMKFHKHQLEEIAQRLGSLPLLLATAARDMSGGTITPGSYLLSLREQDNPGSRMGRAVEDGLKLTLRDLTDEQRHLFTFIGVLGEGSWRMDMLAAVVIDHVTNIQSNLEMLVKRGLVQTGRDKRYRVNVVVREFARQLLHQQSSYVQHAAHVCLAHACLNYARRLTQSLMERPDIRAIAERSTLQYHAYFVHEYQKGMALESSHIQQAIAWARCHEQWHLLLQFAEVSTSELLHSFVANAFDEIRITLALATLVEPVVWQEGQAIEPAFEAFVGATEIHYFPVRRRTKEDEQTYTSIGRELGLNIQAGRIIAGLFEDVCFLDTHWVGVFAVGMICRKIELVGCEFIACDLSQSVWVDGDARQLTLTGSILRYALLHNIRLHRANLRDANLTGAVVEHVTLRGADLRNCNLTSALFHDVDLRGADLRGARVEGAIFYQVRFQGCRTDGVDWTRACIVNDSDSPEQDTLFADLGTTAFSQDKDAVARHPRISAQRKLQTISESKKIDLYNPPQDLNFTGADLRAIADTNVLISACHFDKADFRAARLTHVDFSGADMQGADFRGAILHEPILRRANLRGADLRTARLIDANLEEADLTNAELRFAIIQQGRLQAARLRAARLRCATLTKAQLQGADLSGVDLSYANLEQAQLQGARLVNAHLRVSNLAGADLSGVDLSGSDCDEAIFTGATLTDADLSQAASWRGAILRNGKPVLMINDQNKPDKFPNESTDLRLAYLAGKFVDLHLDGYDLLGVQLTGDFINVSFTRATLDHGRLPGTFSVVNFTYTSLRHTVLSGIFTATRFDEALFMATSLRGIFAYCSFKAVDFQESTFEGASLVNCDFSGAEANPALLRHAFRLRGCIFPDGKRYDGGFKLPGDLQDAATYGYDLTKADQHAVFYSGKTLRISSS